MNIKTFQQNIDLYGADFSRWPAEAVKPALALMENNPAARRCHDDALALDDMLRRYDPPLPALTPLAGRIVEAATWQDEEVVAETVMTLPVIEFKKALGGLMTAAFIGFIIGFLPLPQNMVSAPLLDPVMYNADQIIHGDDLAFYQEGLL